MAYQIKVTGTLDTKTITNDLENWKAKNGTIKMDMETGDILSSIDRIDNGFGKIATVTEKNGQRIATITDNTQKWSIQQENLKSKLAVSTTQVEKMTATVDKMSSKWGASTKGIQEVQSRIAKLQSEYSSLISSSDSLDSTRVKQLNNEQREIQESINLIKAQNQGLNEMGSSTGGMTKLVAQFMSIQKAIQMTVDVMRNIVDEVFKLDHSLTELAKVSDITKSEMGGVTQEAFEMGDKIGRTGREVIDSVANFKSAGYEMKEAFDLGESALVMTNIGDGITDVNEASGVLISTLKGFKMSAQDSEHILDILNNVSNNTASSFSGLADVLQRASATMADSGNSLEQTVGLASGMMEILGSDKSETIGRSLNSITLRLRGNLSYMPHYAQKCA